jgi:CO/xanthine dehydrogenase Mo-binding subunit
MSATRERGALGGRAPRLDAWKKLTGDAGFAGDLQVPGLLHARLVLSPYAHARILSIDTAVALEMPGVQAVLTAKDLPITGGGSRGNEPLAREEAVFAGQPVALVVATTAGAAEDAAELVMVDYEQLDAVVDLVEAMKGDSPLARVSTVVDESDASMHGEVSADAGEASGALSPNVVTHNQLSNGDVARAFANCAAVVAGRFSTPWVYQAYLEPQVAVAWPEGAGGLAIRSSTQAPFFVRQDVARYLGMPITKVRIEGATLGGAFGGKVRLIEPLVAVAALAVGRPVQLVLTRSEDFAATNPAPASIIELRVGADAEGTITALQARVTVDSGSFPDFSPAPLVASRIAGPYAVPNCEVDVYGVRTNRVGAGAYRAPMGTPSAFALESLLDELADHLELDPIDLRIRNTPHADDRRIDGTYWPEIGWRETLETLRDHPLWLGRHDLPAGEGVGFAAGLYPGGKQGAAAVCRMDGDGGFTVVIGYVDMSGTDYAMAAIAADVLTVPVDEVRVVLGDTQTAPHGGMTGGSMVTYCLGNAVQAAAKDARDQIMLVASKELSLSLDELELFDGHVRPVGASSGGISLESIGGIVTGFGPHPPVEGHGVALPPELAPSAAAALVHVRVDPDTSEVRVIAYVAAQDVGRVLNLDLCEGQMRGGAVQAIGFALYEQLIHDEDGQLLTSSFLNYSIPRAEAIPPIETIVVEVPAEHGPLGARGIGESAIMPGTAAVANAVTAATGCRFYDLPLTPERIWNARVPV